MRIAFISLMRFAPWGGSEELWSKTALLALEAGHTVETLTYNWGSRVPPRLLQLKQAGAAIKFYNDDSRAVLDRVAVKLKLRKPQSEVIPEVNADVLVLSNGSVWDFIYNRKITDEVLNVRRPYIIISHNTLDYGGIVVNADRDYAIKVLREAAKRLFVSERNRQGAERQLAHSLTPYQVVSNPVSIRQVGIKPFPSSDKLLMASVGSLDCGIKGQDLLLEALSGETWKHRDFRLEIYGTGPDKSYLYQLINYYGLQDKVHLKGHVSDTDLIWETNQVLIVSSITEGVPMVVVEAMLSGRAVLGTDVGAVDRYVRDGQTGFLVPVAKAKYLAFGLEKIWTSRAALKQMGENAFNHTVATTDTQPERSFLSIIEASI